jgi:DNA-binding LacI/PurR family transcriptional regulator
MLSALSAYRHGESKRFAGVLAYVLNYDPALYQDNQAEAMLAKAVAGYAKSQGFSLETFQVTDAGMTGPQLSRVLRARGIHGVLLSPRLPVPGPISDLDWPRFSTVAVGYSITNVAAHRVCIHHAYNMRLCLRKLRERGYQRIGLIVKQDFSERSLGVMLGSYLAEQYGQPAANKVLPLYTQELNQKIVGKWLKSQRVDCVVLPGASLEVYDWIQQLGYQVPGDVGLALISRFGQSDHVAGIDEQRDGAEAGAAPAHAFAFGNHFERPAASEVQQCIGAAEGLRRGRRRGERGQRQQQARAADHFTPAIDRTRPSARSANPRNSARE